MNKSQLVSAIAESAEIPVVKAEKALGAAIDSIIDALTQGGSVSLVGFGSFGVRKRSARKVRNPRTGEEMTIDSKLVPFFKAGKNLKDAVDSDSEK